MYLANYNNFDDSLMYWMFQHFRNRSRVLALGTLLAGTVAIAVSETEEQTIVKIINSDCVRDIETRG